jgi:pimeloyl-ACP methyl ester carboxylesterase
MTRPPFYPFRSEPAKAEYEAYCRDRARAWPVPCETVLLDTPAGRTFVRASGRTADPPLVLLPGARVGSLMWLDMIAALSAGHRTYALDIVGDVGLSVHRGDIRTPADYVTWLHEVLTELVPEGPVSLMGVSLGGSIAAQYALRFPARLRSVVLVAPAATVLRLSPGFFVRLVVLTLSLRARGQSRLRRTLDWLFADAVRGDGACRARLERAIDELERAVRAFALPRPPWPAVLTDEQWRTFPVDCLFLVGEREKIYSADTAVRRLARVAPRVKSEIIGGAGHDLTLVKPDVVTGRALEFLAVREDPVVRSTSAAR